MDDKNYSDPTQDVMHARQACPTCKNDDVDKLIWDDPDDVYGYVTCLTCSTRYRPSDPSDVQHPN